jgi:hypothetical protein
MFPFVFGLGSQNSFDAKHCSTGYRSHFSFVKKVPGYDENDGRVVGMPACSSVSSTLSQQPKLPFIYSFLVP